MQRMVVSAILGLFAGIVGPVAAATAPDPFWLHPYNFFGEETALTASVNLGDLDRDGDLDAAVARDLMPVLLLFNDGTAHFSETRELGPVAQARSIASADLDGDGDQDLVLVQRGEANRYFLNDGQGNFGPDIELPGAWQTIQVAIGDVDADGRIDLAFSNRGGEGVVLYRGRMTGGYAEPELLGGELDMEIRAIELGDEASDTYNLSVGDLNDDGRPDIVYAVSEGSNYSLINRIEPD